MTEDDYKEALELLEHSRNALKHYHGQGSALANLIDEFLEDQEDDPFSDADGDPFAK